MSEPPDNAPARHRRPRASALSYERGTKAPRIVANGVGLVAERIVAAAHESGVPVRQDPALVEALALLDLGDEIPEPLFVAVAEALAWAYRLDARAGGAG
jgi:flagellar biosynthesis protein